MKRRKGYFWLIPLVVVYFVMGCASIQQAMEPTAKVTSSGGANINQARMERYDGKKARITVTGFVDKTYKGRVSGEITQGISSMLTTALFNTNRYVVLERQLLMDVIGEQDLGASGRVQKGTAAKIGKIEGAELLIYGEVTGFEPGASGAGGGVGGGSYEARAVGALFGAFKTAHIAMDIRIIDSQNSRILSAISVEGKAKDFNLGGLVLGSHVGGGLGGYNKTPIDKAIRIALGKAVQRIVENTPDEFYRYK